MSARTIRNGSLRHDDGVTFVARQTRLTLPQEAVVIHRGGIEFRSEVSFPKWVEMTVSLQASDGGKLNCSGVVIDCRGNRHTGYQVSMVFTGLTEQAALKLNKLAFAQLR